jgi:hypothetical protein
MLDLRSILVFSEDPRKLSDFYKKVFQKNPDWVMEGYSDVGMVICIVKLGHRKEVCR